MEIHSEYRVRSNCSGEFESRNTINRHQNPNRCKGIAIRRGIPAYRRVVRPTISGYGVRNTASEKFTRTTLENTMAITITWFGHNAWAIDIAGSKLLLDPFLNDSPTAPIKADAVEADYILLSHGHGDHLGDTVAIAKRTGATVVTNFEVSQWLAGQGLATEKLVGL